jgi:hypothetical protein
LIKTVLRFDTGRELRFSSRYAIRAKRRDIAVSSAIRKLRCASDRERIIADSLSDAWRSGWNAGNFPQAKLHPLRETK